MKKLFIYKFVLIFIVYLIAFFYMLYSENKTFSVTVILPIACVINSAIIFLIKDFKKIILYAVPLFICLVLWSLALYRDSILLGLNYITAILFCILPIYISPEKFH